MKLFVWDFHGVIEQGNEEAAIEVSNLALEKLGYQERFLPEHAALLTGRKWFEYFEFLLPNKSHEEHVALSEESFTISNSQPEVVLKSLRRNDGVTEVLTAIHESPHKQILISNTKPESLEMYINALNLGEFFPDGFALAVDAHKKEVIRNKIDLLKDFLEDKDFEEIIIIGDSPSDMALKSVGKAKTYLYIYPGRKHRESEADYKIWNLQEILKELG